MPGCTNENTLDTLAATGCTCNSNTKPPDTSFLSYIHFLNSHLSIQANLNQNKTKQKGLFWLPDLQYYQLKTEERLVKTNAQ